MSQDADDIAISLARAGADMEGRIQAHVERAFGRALLKLGILGVGGFVVAAGTTIVKVNDAIHDYRDSLNGLERQIADMGKQVAPLPALREQTTKAQHDADIANAKIDGHLSPDPKARR